MARIVFFLPDGTQKSFRLFTDRILRIGREPGNDAVLRDAKISRRHAEVSFERGFYVIHDVGSANGTWVNGKKVRIAPLTDGADLRIGATLGRFTEELSENEPTPTVFEEKDPGNVFRTESPDASPPPFVPPPEPSFAPEPDEQMKTRPHRRGSADDLAEAPPEEDEAENEEMKQSHSRSTVEAPFEKQEIAVRSPGSPYSDSSYVIDMALPGCGVVRDSSERPLLYFRPPMNAALFIAGAVMFLMGAAGATTAILLVAGGDLTAAAVAVFLTAVFILMTLGLIPRRSFELFEDEEMTALHLVIAQESASAFPRLRFCARTREGSAIAYFHKSALSNAGRRSWSIFGPDQPDPIGSAIEDSIPRALLRKALGSIIHSLTTDFLIEAGGRMVGRIRRRATVFYRSLLELDPEPRLLEARVAVALAVLIEGVERR